MEMHMPPREPGLPEGTDKVINGASGSSSGGSGRGATGGSGTGSTGSGSTASSGGGTGSSATGSSGSGSTTGTGGGSSSGGFVATGSGNDTGAATSSTGGATDKIVGQVRDQVSNLREQATGKAREYAEGGKDRTAELLTNLSEIIQDAARSIDERLGDQYGEYAHKAGDAVSGLAGNLKDKSLDDLVDGTRSLVRKSPAITVGTAALLGFVLVRLVKSGLEQAGGGTSGGGTRSRSGSGRSGGEA
jgi:ElaB/YqjD/DUF883 family membrane-anchored ribosome-binding protein